ncbi:MAG TPA: metallophosphoesterase [Verrucomicrobiae bacterium]
MPIYLGPISRRRFLARSLAAGAGLMLAPELLAAGKRTDPDCWALLSDTHLAADHALKVRGINMLDHATRVRGEVLGLPRRPAGVLITGDCAYNSGLAGDYAVLSEILLPIRADKVPVRVALGNHDDRSNFWEAFAEDKAAAHPVADRQVALVETPRANWYILDSLEKTLSTPGLLGPEQLQWLAKALDANPKKPALVVAHHNPGLNGGNMGLKDTLLLFDVIRPRKQVKAYIYGHTHVWKVEQDPSGIHLINLPPVSYVFRETEPSGWVLATLKRKGVRLQLRCLDPSHKAQGQTVDLKWRS